MIETRTRPTYWAAFSLILLLAAALRFVDLGAKPMHGDEANQALKAAHLLETGEYAYDPFEHHGPTLYYLTLPIFWASGTQTLIASSETQYRLVPAVFGVICVALIVGLRGVLGPSGTLWAALLTAISHAMLYYGRYYIQETLFIAFALAALVAAWHFLLDPSLRSALCFGVAVGLAQATKETAILLYAAAGLAGVLCLVAHRVRTGAWPVLRAHLRPRFVAAAVLAALAVCVVLYSSFGTHPRGVLDAVLTYSRYFSRADGTGSAALHDKPFLYYLELLAFCYREPGPRWTEGFALITGALGAVLALVQRGGEAPANDDATLLARARAFRLFLALYALILVFLFSAVPYKTPWNLLPFLQPVLLLAGLGIGWLTTAPRSAVLRGVLCLACSVAVAHAGRQAYLGAFVYPADTRNPYVYAHTSTALAHVVERLAQIAAVALEGKALRVAVIGADGDYWPLPWYLRAYPNVGYWNAPPDDLDADVIISSTGYAAALAKQFHTTHHADSGALRPGVMLGVFIRTPLWEAFMAPRR